MHERTLPGHVRANRAYWDACADEWIASAERDWAEEPSWGCWHLPESQLRLLPEDMRGMTAIELGCGTAYVSAWMVRRGAVVVGIDNSERQLATARRLASEHRVELTLHHGNAETVPYPRPSLRLRNQRIWRGDLVYSRSLDPRGASTAHAPWQLVFLGHTPLAVMCMAESGAPCEPRLHRSHHDVARIDWTQCAIDPGGIEFNLPLSGWLRLFCETGFEVLDYLELLAPAGSEDCFSVPAAWAERWPAEQVWKLRRISTTPE